MKLKLDETGEIITLRLLLVDTPESVKKGVDPQPYSIEASNFTKSTLYLVILFILNMMKVIKLINMVDT